MPIPRTGDRVIVKLGGSLIADRERLVEIIASLKMAPTRIVVVTGGGPYADAVREVQGRLRISDRLAHRQALQAMNHFAEAICELDPALVMAATRAEVDAAHAAGRIPVFLTERVLSGGGGLPESWAVTSDTYAAFLAFEFDAAGLILVKSTDAPAKAGAEELARTGLVDAAFPTFAARLSCPIRIVGPSSLASLQDLVGLPHSRVASIVTNA